MLNPLPDQEFFCREAEVRRLFHAGLDITRSQQPSVLLSGKRKIGKTEILKRVYNRLFWEQENVIPFFHAFPKSIISAETFCREYFLRSLLQFIGFLKKDAKLILNSEIDLSLIPRLAYETQYPWLIELVDLFHSLTKNPDLQKLSRLAVFFPEHAAQKRGCCAFVFLDDFHHITSLESPGDRSLLLGDFLSALQSRKAPHLLAGPSQGAFRALCKLAELPGNVDISPLRPLRPSEAQGMFEGLCHCFDVPFETRVSGFIVEQLEGNPFYIRTLVQAARRQSKGLRTIKGFVELYSDELMQGSFHLFFSSLIHSASLNPQEKLKAVEVMHLCTLSAGEFHASQYLRNQARSEEFEIEKIMNSLDELGLIEYGLGMVASIQDPVLRDWIEWNYQRKFQSLPQSRVAYDIASGLFKRFGHSLHLKDHAAKIQRIKELMVQMDCQNVPAFLLDYGQFQHHGEIVLSQEKATDSALEAEVTLPEMISVDLRSAAMPEKSHFSDYILVGHGFESGLYNDEAETAWLAACLPGDETVGLDEVEQFYKKSQQVIREENLNRVKLWLVGGKKFNQAATSFAKENQIYTSSSEQLKNLSSRIMAEEPLVLSEDQLREVVQYEMVIPMSADTELVAVRALEQIAESIEFDEKSKGQMRMALMEACINVKENLPNESGKIHLNFQTALDRLIIQMYVEVKPGLQFSGKGASQGWSLKMLRTLMDDVQVSHTARGFELVMIKYPQTARKEAI